MTEPHTNRLGPASSTFAWAQLAAVALILVATVAFGQTNGPTGKHHRVRGDMAPGLAAERYRMADASLTNVIQPVRIIAPKETSIEVISGGGVLASAGSRVTMGLAIGPVYRIKVGGLRLHETVQLYPTIEVLGRLNPPAGMENQFPIEIEITRDDLERVIEGRMVTKVIYLEHGDMVVPHRHTVDRQPSFDVSASEDPLQASEAMGRPMAILRIGSRVPLNGDAADGILTIGPQPVILPEPIQFGEPESFDQPQSGATGRDTHSMDRPARLPPIVPGTNPRSKYYSR